MYWTYEKLDENYNPISLPTNDFDGTITGKIIINLKSYFDENPQLRKSLGWIKHIKKKSSEIEGYDPQTQNIMVGSQKIDDYTIVDEYYLVDKTEEQMLYEELGLGSGFFSIGGLFDI